MDEHRPNGDERCSVPASHTRRGGVETPSGKGRDDENFPVGSWLIRRELRTHVHAFYRFARNADDIADNPDLAAGDKVRRLDRMAAVLEARRATMRRRRQRCGEPRRDRDDRAALPRRAARVPPGREQAALPRLGRADGVLPLFGLAGRAAVARPARREPRHLAGLRRAVLCLAGAQPPAGLRRRLPQPRPRLPAARPMGAAGVDGRGADCAGRSPGLAPGARPAARPHRRLVATARGAAGGVRRAGCAGNRR